MIEKILNDQINKEALASQLYLSHSIWANTMGYDGFASFLYKQSNEEREHMMKIVNHMIVRDLTPEIGTIPAVKEKPETIYECFHQVYDHECYITKSIEDIINISMEKKDWKTFEFMQWFIKEQIEEENHIKSVLDKFNIAGKNNISCESLLLLNEQSKSW